MPTIWGMNICLNICVKCVFTPCCHLSLLSQWPRTSFPFISPFHLGDRSEKLEAPTSLRRKVRKRKIKPPKIINLSLVRCGPASSYIQSRTNFCGVYATAGLHPSIFTEALLALPVFYFIEPKFIKLQVYDCPWITDIAIIFMCHSLGDFSSFGTTFHLDPEYFCTSVSLGSFIF